MVIFLACMMLILGYFSIFNTSKLKIITCILFPFMMVLATGCSSGNSKIASVSSTKLDTEKYNLEIASILSLSDGVKESNLISKTDMDTINELYNENASILSKSDDIQLDFMLKSFIEELKTDILLKYNHKYYRNEYNIPEPGDYDMGNRLSQEQIDETSVIYKDISTLYDYFLVLSDMDDDMLERIHKLCDRYRSLSERQQGLVYNSIKLAELVESFGGSLETNFNLELWKYNIKKFRGEDVGEYTGPSDEELGIVQGNRMYGESYDTLQESTTEPSTVDDSTDYVRDYDVDSASFDDLETRLQIPENFYDCVVDTGSSGTNYIDDEKLMAHIAELDSKRLYSVRNNIYAKISDSNGEIQLLNWGTLNYYKTENKYNNYTVKDYAYWVSGRFKVGLISDDGKDYKVLTGNIKDGVIYFDSIDNILPKFEVIHIDATEKDTSYVDSLENVPYYEDTEE